ncbi:MAG TPA: EamA family transporter [Xanthobacteraceae bacterium]|jgi:drug/metabolite transporter (DMT)-like permease|nr:EamA family transporter [Xanthobacteraceae bacterium]
MLDTWAWALFTVIAAFSQTVRNAAQRQLTATLGTVGATHVRFLFGFPFSLLFLAGVMLAGGAELPHPGLAYWGWVFDGALAQVAATALMLKAMSERSFVVTIAYIKTEPVQVALFGLLLLGDVVTPSLALAILIATAGVVVMSVKLPPPFPPPQSGGGLGWGIPGGTKPTLFGLAAGATFGLSAVGFRGAILSLGSASYLMAATFTLVVGLLLQSLLLSAYLWLRDRAALRAIIKSWRPSLFAGFVGALASQFWFLAFALATAASVRTLALVEVLFAQGISRFAFGQATSRRELLGIALIVIGCVLLIWSQS